MNRNLTIATLQQMYYWSVATSLPYQREVWRDYKYLGNRKAVK